MQSVGFRGLGVEGLVFGGCVNVGVTPDTPGIHKDLARMGKLPCGSEGLLTRDSANEL